MSLWLRIEGAWDDCADTSAAQARPGLLLALGGAPEGIAIIRTGTVAVAVCDPNQVVVFELSAPETRRIIPLGGSARHLFLCGPDGPAADPPGVDDRFVALGLPAGQVLEGTSVASQVTCATVQLPNTVAVDDGSGEVVLTGSTPKGSLQFIPLGAPPTGPSVTRGAARGRATKQGARTNC